jgi:peptidoglycan/LPS O-acetylase OafA/YrhL
VLRINTYRPDIDGLRAIAIAIVLMFHLNVGFTKGGYVGVDVFFVISGFLITGIILKGIEAGRFSFLHFYERRIRRLFPALVAAFAASSLVGLAVLYPVELEAYGESLASAVLFAANIFFYSGRGYFADDTGVLPLHHTWSLAVEEQFYLFFPILLILLSRFRRPVMNLLISLIAVLSFGLSLYYMSTSPEAAFYLLLPRAWELAIGALLAAGAVPLIASGRMRQVAAALGLIAILIAAGAFNKRVPFPGWSALLPCIGAALIIHSGRERDTLVYRLLSHPWGVLLGLASYSIYVWHVPIIAYYRLEFGDYIDNTDKIILAFICLAVGFLSWRFIERPFRYGGWLPERRLLFQASGGAMAAVLAVSAILVAGKGLETRFPLEARQLVAFRAPADPEQEEGPCFISSALAKAPGVDPHCLALEPGKKNYLLMGDSFAIHYRRGFEDAFPQLRLLVATASGCKPLLKDTGAARCRRVMNDAFYNFLPHHQVDGVIISGLWTKADLPDVLPTIQYLQQFTSNVIVMGPTPIYHDKLPRLLARSILRNDPEIVNRERDASRAALDAQFATALAGGPAKYVSVINALCDGRGCVTRDEKGDPIQSDYGHFTRAGARLLARLPISSNAFASLASFSEK